MDAFVWNDRFAVGHAAIDDQHRRLFDLINRVGDLLVTPGAVAANEVDQVFAELTNYAHTHFAEEERLMREWNVAAAYIDHHASQHASFTAQVSMLQGQYLRMSAPADVLHGFLVAWLAYHILAEDQAMARLIVRQKNGMSPEEAWRQEAARGERATDALIEALQKLYDTMARLNRDLADSNNALEAKMASVGQFTARIAREINNPVSLVNTNLGALSRRMDDLLRLAVLGAVTPEGEALKRKIGLDCVRADVDDLLRESQDALDRVRKIVADLKDVAQPVQSG